MEEFDKKLLEGIVVPESDSHKGDNGRVLVIGGSKLFHSSIFWSADVASRIVDLVHFTSPAMENNDLVRVKAKEGFWSGIVVSWEEVDDYIKEDDCVLIGPGMPREEGEMERDVNTGEVVNKLVSEYPKKRWVVDGGALQEIDPKLLSSNMIITPHHGEFERVFGEAVKFDLEERVVQVEKKSREYGGVVVLLKSEVDVVSDGSRTIIVRGGNPGMTKGGTGDVLAGLVAALYAKSDAFVAASAASYVNKKAGDVLYEEVGPFFSAGELVMAVPEVLAGEVDL